MKVEVRLFATLQPYLPAGAHGDGAVRSERHERKSEQRTAQAEVLDEPRRHNALKDHR